LSNTNEKATVSILQNILELNKALEKHALHFKTIFKTLILEFCCGPVAAGSLETILVSIHEEIEYILISGLLFSKTVQVPY